MIDKNGEFDELLDQYHHAWFRFHPYRETGAGRYRYAGELRPFEDGDMGALISLNEELLNALAEFDEAELDRDRRIDRRLMLGAAYLENEHLLGQDWRHRAPQDYLPVDAVFALTVRPVPDRGLAIGRRLRRMPDYLWAARAKLATTAEQIPPLWLESAATEARSGAGFVKALGDDPEIARAVGDGKLFEEEITAAAQALMNFADFLEEDLAGRAQGDFACGHKRFGDLLKHRHFIDASADTLHRFGRNLFETSRLALGDLCREMTGGDDIAGLLARIEEGAAVADPLAAFRDSITRSRRFITEHDLVSVPPTESLEVIHTPGFLRHHVPFAAYMEPAPTDPGQVGHYFVTPPGAGEAGRTGRFTIDNTSVHEGYPGHHLQFVRANLAAPGGRLARQLNPSATLFEGWALYCEQLMHDSGFLDRPEHRVLLLRDRMWRAMRVMLDVEMHCRGLGVDAAADRMVAELGFSRAQALADLTWYTMSPTVPMGYATGWALINAARDRLRAEEPGLSDKDFHDALLDQGTMAVTLGLDAAFRPGLAATAGNMVFGD